MPQDVHSLLVVLVLGPDIMTTVSTVWTKVQKLPHKDRPEVGWASYS